MRKLLSLLLVLPMLLLAASAEAQTVIQKLDPAASKFHFSVKGSMLELSGKFNKYTGSLTLDRSTLAPNSVWIKLDISDVNVAPIENMPFLSPEAVFQSLPNPVAIFQSTKITPLGGNKYRAEGKITRGGKEWPGSFTAVLIKHTRQGSEAMITMSGSAADFISQVPLPTGGSKQQGTIEARLVFKG